MRVSFFSLIVLALFGVGCSDDGSVAAEPASSAADSIPANTSGAVNDAGARGDSSPSTSGSTTSTTTTNTTSTTSTTSTVLVVPVVPDPETTVTTPVTTLPAMVGLPEEGKEGLNEGGVPITLDETATLACANAEFARDSINFANLEQAERDVAAAADRAEPSAQPDIAEAADLIRGAMDAPDPLAVVDAFLDICVDHGHQI